MPACDRYEKSEPTHNGRFRSRHRTLDREVEVVCFASDSWSDGRHADFLQQVSRMAELDHPCLPHLIDLLRVDEAYQIVFEPTVAEEVHGGQEILELISRLSQAADALTYARERQIAHGALTADSFRGDELGNLKLVGVGILQCGEPQSWQELSARDLQDLVQRTIAAVRPTLDRNLDAVEAAKLRELLDIAEEFAVNPQANEMHEFNSLMRSWLQEAVARRSAKLLQVAADEPLGLPRAGRRTNWRAASLAMGSLCLVLLTGWWIATMRPARDHSLSRQPSEQATRARRADEATPPVTSSELAKVGVINNPHTEQRARDRSVRDEPARNPARADDPQVTPIRAGDATETHADAAPRTVPSVRRNPFQELPISVALPSRETTSPKHLMALELPPDVPLRIDLVGGPGAGRQVDFSLTQDEHGESAIIRLERREAPTPIARLDRGPGGLEFQWLPAAAAMAAADFLQNTVVQLTVRPWKEGFALREVLTRPALRSDLERKKPYDVDIPAPPQMEDVFIEFVPQPGSVTKASPSNEMAAIDGVLRIGLDAGKDSKVVLLVESLFRSRRKLRLTALARLTEDAAWVPVQSGAAAQLRNDLLVSTLALNRMRVDHVKDKDQKAAMRIAIRATTHKLEILRRFKSSFTAAQGTPLHFRIYRRVDAYRVPLVEFKDEQDDTRNEAAQ